jgi:DeoR/GlpR family transcriptional regulator of sugar metabolism
VSSTREEAIVSWVEADGRVALADLAERCGVSEMTIRRDLDSLTAAGRLQRVRGGAVRLPAPGDELSGSTAGLASARPAGDRRRPLSAAAPAAQAPPPPPSPPAGAAQPSWRCDEPAPLPGAVITLSQGVEEPDPWEGAADAALSVLGPLLDAGGGVVVLLTGGPGCTAVARRLRATAATGPSPATSSAAVTAVVTSIAPAAVLAGAPGIRLVVLGGEADPGSDELVGAAALAALDDLHVDLAVLTPSGVDVRGAWAPTSSAAQLHAAVARAADRVVAVVGPGALGRPGRVRAVGLGDLDRVVAVSGTGEERDDVAARLGALRAGAPTAPELVTT